MLADFGITPKARAPLTVEAKAAAAAKRAATRAARHTMGTQQKKGIKGDVTGVLVTPITAASPTVAAPASPTPPATSGATAPRDERGNAGCADAAHRLGSHGTQQGKGEGPIEREALPRPTFGYEGNRYRREGGFRVDRTPANPKEWRDLYEIVLDVRPPADAVRARSRGPDARGLRKAEDDAPLGFRRPSPRSRST